VSGDAKPVFVDTNVLIYATFAHLAQHTIARTYIDSAEANAVPLWISRQVLREFAVVVTRPQTFMTPVTSTAAGAHVRAFLKLFKVADEDHSVTAHWLHLLDTIPLAGKQVHDANIVATMQANQLDQLLTNNVADFKRFANLITIIPLIPSSATPQPQQ
jgi:predicted nucleic acid-binding protein